MVAYIVEFSMKGRIPTTDSALLYVIGPSVSLVWKSLNDSLVLKTAIASTADFLKTRNTAALRTQTKHVDLNTQPLQHPVQTQCRHSSADITKEHQTGTAKSPRCRRLTGHRT